MSMARPAKHILFIRTSSMSFVFLRGQIDYLRSAGFEVTCVSAPGEGQPIASGQGARVIGIPIERQPSPIGDLVSLWRFYRLLRRLKPDLVHAGTPKAGLLGSIAARLAGVPGRMYFLMGLRFETLTGWKRRIAVQLERIACACAVSIPCVSPSLRARAVAEGLARPEKLVAVGQGSSNGVNVSHFTATPALLAQADSLRKQWAFPEDAFVIGFVGRLVRDKGVAELLEAFETVRSRITAKLVLVGDLEEGDPISDALRHKLANHQDVRVVPFVADPAPVYRLIDVLALPTYREGFPNVVLEAQASERPVVTTNATGAIDSVVDGQTGLIVPVKDAAKLAEALLRIARLPDRGRAMGKAGRARVEKSFDRQHVWENLRSYYESVARTISRQRGIGSVFKWIFDRLFALVLLVTLIPVLVAAGLFVLVTMGWPVIFRQGRVGRKGKTIYVHKFRTMTNERDAKGELLPDAHRLGRVGRTLRALSLDELPQLWDVLRGAVSFVGPRPLLERYKDRYNPEQWRRHNVFPGITGWAQINGRNAISWEQKFELDVWYVDHWSFWLDMKILALTLWRTLRRDGISYANEATMPEFMPSSKTKSAHE